VGQSQRDQLLSFAADFIGNVTDGIASTDLNVSFGLILFGHQEMTVEQSLGTDPDDFVVAGINSDIAVGMPPDTALALEECSMQIYRRNADISIVVVITNDESEDTSLTAAEVEHLKYQGAKEVTVIAVGMDSPWSRSPARQVELERLATSSDFQYDAYYAGQEEPGRRLRSSYPRMALSELASRILPSVYDAFYMATTTIEPEEEPGVGAGVIVLAVLGSLCCFSSVAAAVFLVCKKQKEAREQRELSQVVPISNPPREAPKAPLPVRVPVPVEPDDEVQLQMKAAVGAQDLRRVRMLLGDILLKGWPPKKYNAIILKALEFVESKRPEAESALRRAMNRRVSTEMSACAADARLCGVEESVIREAEELRMQLTMS